MDLVDAAVGRVAKERLEHGLGDVFGEVELRVSELPVHCRSDGRRRNWK